MDARLEQGLDGASLRGEAATVRRAADDVEDARSRLAHASEQRQHSQDQLFAAWRRMRLLERLEERGRRKHEREEQRIAQRNHDEAGQIRWWGRNR